MGLVGNGLEVVNWLVECFVMVEGVNSLVRGGIKGSGYINPRWCF